MRCTCLRARLGSEFWCVTDPWCPDHGDGLTAIDAIEWFRYWFRGIETEDGS